MRTENKENHSLTNSAVTRQVFVDALLVQHLYSAIFQYMVWYGSSLFFKPFKFRCCSFCFIKEYVQSTAQVCCLFYFLLDSTFFKGKEKSGIFGRF